LSFKLKVIKILRQCDAIAAVLFNIVLGTAVRRSKVENGGTIFDDCSQLMAYAADMASMGGRLQEGTEGFTSVVEQTNKMGIEINVKSTKFIIVSRKA
jgi:hypothetical protein